MRFLKQIVIVVFLIIFLIGCQKQVENEVEIVKVGSIVLIDYAAGYLNGTLFDTTFEGASKIAGIFNPNRIYQPMQLTVGQGKIVKGVEEALLGMKEGEAKTVTIPPEKAYGFYRKNSIKQISIETFGDDINNLREGTGFIMRTPQGEVPVLIKKIGKENVTVDFNHPLAGQTVTFAIIVRDIQ